jgi:secreted Zn-dependent insulinase-like peptidase
MGKKKLGLPPVNNLIPKNFGILAKNKEYSETPQLLKQWPGADLWYKKDDKFDRPKSVVSMKIYTKDCDLGTKPESHVFMNMWANMQNDYLREFNYMANCANLSFSVTPMYDNLNFTWSGFNDSMPNYIEESITRLLEMKTEKEGGLREFFDQSKEKLLADCKNFYYEQSY